MRTALIVGIDDYPLSLLNGCINNAQRIAELLSKDYDGTSNFDCLLLTNVTSKNFLLQKFQNLCECQSAVSIFYFSGFGTPSGFIMTPDSSEYDEGIAFAQILNMANESKSDEMIIILDTAYSGSMGSPLSFNLGGDMYLRKGVTVITNKNHMPEPNIGEDFSIFTSLICAALEGAASDLLGNISMPSIYSFVVNNLGPWTEYPLFKANSTRVTRIRRSKPLLSHEVILKIVEYFPAVDYKLPLDPSFEFTTENAETNNVVTFRNLQKLASSNLVEPVGEENLYWAAVNSKYCKLTSIGRLYWRLIKQERY